MASRGINKIILIGNCGKDPETRYSASGSAVTTVSVATGESWRDKQTGETQERTEWHRVVMFARLGEVARDYLRKGSKVYVEGRLQTRKWQGQDGADRYTTEVVANDMQMLDSRTASGQPSDRREGQPADRREGQPADRREGQPADRREGQPADRREGAPDDQPHARPAPASSAQTEDFVEDDIPF